MNQFTPNRTHYCTDPQKRCFTHLNPMGSVVRGCYFENANQNSVQKRCELDPDNCEICKGDRCNSRPTRMYCYICSAQNSLCQYDQMHQGISLCPGADEMEKKLGCFTVVRWVKLLRVCVDLCNLVSCSPDGLVERGCWKGEFKCPSPDSNCISCDTIGCNNGTYHIGQCLECSGPADGDCAQNVEYLDQDWISKPCPVLIDLPLCYVGYKSGNMTVVERGCTAKNQYRAWMEPACSRGLMQCSFCNGDNCNYWTRDLYLDDDEGE